jgi:hypothetical protein
MSDIPTFDSRAVALFVASHYVAAIRYDLLTASICTRTLLRTTLKAGGGNARIEIKLDDVLRDQVLALLQTEFDVAKRLVTVDGAGQELEESDEYIAYDFSIKPFSIPTGN